MKYQHPARHRLISLVSKSSHAISIGSSMIAGTSWIMLIDVVGTSVTRCCNGQTHTHIHLHIQTCVCILCIRVCLYIYICVYTSIYQILPAHTHTRIYTNMQAFLRPKTLGYALHICTLTRCSPSPALLVNLAGPHWHFVTGCGAMGSMVLLGKMSSSWVSNVFNRVSLL